MRKASDLILEPQNRRWQLTDATFRSITFHPAARRSDASAIFWNSASIAGSSRDK